MEKIDAIMPVYIINEELLQLTKNAIESLKNVNLIIIDLNKLKREWVKHMVGCEGLYDPLQALKGLIESEVATIDGGTCLP